MAGATNRGKYIWAGVVFRGETLTTKYYIALVTDTPDQDTNVFSDLTEIATGNGYSAGGFELTPGGTDFDLWSEIDGSTDVGRVQIKDVDFVASGGNIPASGDGALFAVLLNHHATPASRDVLAYWSLSSARTVSDSQTLSLNDLQIDFAET
mgnify:CR=1 FL=1